MFEGDLLKWLGHKDEQMVMIFTQIAADMREIAVNMPKCWAKYIL